MSEDRTNKDPLLGGLDGMRAGQHWAGEPDSLKHTEGQQASAESDTAAADPAEKTEKVTQKGRTAGRLGKRVF